LSRIPETEKCGESEEESDRGQAVDTRRERDREKGKDEGPFRVPPLFAFVWT